MKAAQKLSRDELIVIMRRSGMSYARIGRHHRVKLTGQRVKSICIEMEAKKKAERSRKRSDFYIRQGIIDVPVVSLCLPIRIQNALEGAGILTTDKLLAMSDTDLLKLRTFGPKSLQVIKQLRKRVGR